MPGVSLTAMVRLNNMVIYDISLIIQKETTIVQMIIQRWQEYTVWH